MSVYRIEVGHATDYATFVASTTNIVADWPHASNGYPWRIATLGIVNHGSRVRAISSKAYRRGNLSLRWDMGSPINKRQLEYIRDTIFTDADTAISRAVTIMTDNFSNLGNANVNKDWPVIRCYVEECPEDEIKVAPNGKITGYYWLFSGGVYLAPP